MEVAAGLRRRKRGACCGHLGGGSGGGRKEARRVVQRDIGRAGASSTRRESERGLNASFACNTIARQQC